MISSFGVTNVEIKIVFKIWDLMVAYAPLSKLKKWTNESVFKYLQLLY